MDVTISLPESQARQWGDTPQAIARHVFEDAVLERYRSGGFSHHQVGEALGVDYWQTDRFLSARGARMNYLVDDLQTDEATFGKMALTSGRGELTLRTRR